MADAPLGGYTPSVFYGVFEHPTRGEDFPVPWVRVIPWRNLRPLTFNESWLNTAERFEGEKSVVDRPLSDDPTSSNESTQGGSRLISRLLPPAVRLWLVSQVEHVEDLVFKLEGRDRQILSGYIPQVEVSARRAIYQGIHVSQIAVQAQEIRVNLGQILRGKQLRLLAAFEVNGDLSLTEADLNTSLNSPLLEEGLYNFLTQLAAAEPEAAVLKNMLEACPEKTVHPYYDCDAKIETGTITLQMIPRTEETLPPITIATGLVIIAGRYLQLQNPQWLADGKFAPLPALQGFQLDLGPEVDLRHCSLTPGQMALAGMVRVWP